MIRRRAPEASLQRTVCEWLKLARLPNVIYFAVPNGMQSHPIIVARMKAQGLLPGVADLCIVKDGRAYFLELKAPNGIQSPEQRSFQMACIAAATPYAIARDIKEAVTILTAWGAIRPDAARSVINQKTEEANVRLSANL